MVELEQRHECCQGCTQRVKRAYVHYTIQSGDSGMIHPPLRTTSSLFLAVAVSSVLWRHYDWSPPCLSESLVSCSLAVCSDCRPYSHEKSTPPDQRLRYRVIEHDAHPNVAAEPVMYCPNVLIIPFGPGPKRIMFVAPNMKPMIRPTAEKGGRSIDESLILLILLLTSSHHCSHLDCVMLAKLHCSKFKDDRTFIKG